MKMTNREAIEILQGSIISEERNHDGKPNGNITCDLTREALEMAIEALKRQKTGHWIYESGYIPYCSVCGAYSDDADRGIYFKDNEEIVEDAKFCPNCGCMMQEE